MKTRYKKCSKNELNCIVYSESVTKMAVTRRYIYRFGIFMDLVDGKSFRECG